MKIFLSEKSSEFSPFRASVRIVIRQRLVTSQTDRMSHLWSMDDRKFSKQNFASFQIPRRNHVTTQFFASLNLENFHCQCIDFSIRLHCQCSPRTTCCSRSYVHFSNRQFDIPLSSKTLVNIPSTFASPALHKLCNLS